MGNDCSVPEEGSDIIIEKEELLELLAGISRVCNQPHVMV